MGVNQVTRGKALVGEIVGDTITVTYRQSANGSLVDETFFIADRAYQVMAIREVHATAGNDAGAVAAQITKDTGTAAPGAGTDLLTSTGFNMKATANTVQAGTLVGTAATLLLAAGDRLAIDFNGTLTSLAGVVVTVVLKRL